MPEIMPKRVAISKANAQMVGVVAAAAFITVFCLFAARAVYTQNRYLGRVTKVKEKAHRQLQDNLKSYDSLVSAYQQFDKVDPNVIGGSRGGKADNDGSNSKIILDALPSSYDFPALTSSLEKILTDRGLKVGGITGTDDQLAQEKNSSSTTPQPVTIPFSFSVTNANYDAVKKLTEALQHSIRPMPIDAIDLSGGQNDLTVTVTAHTYYQPGKSVNITKQVVK